MGTIPNFASFQVSYELCPITLVGGIAGPASGGPPGAMIPIISLLPPYNSTALTGQLDDSPGPDDYFAKFTLIPGGTLLENQIAEWPLANQAVAANAVIAQPLKLSLAMVCPAGDVVSYLGKLSVMTALQSSLLQHTAQGGWYNVATPSFIYQGCLLKMLTDITELERGGQVQAAWRWDFEQPLITTQGAQGAQNQAMAKISAQTKLSGDPPGTPSASLGVNAPSSNFAPAVVPAGAGSVGTGTAPASQGNGPVQVSSVAPIPPGS